jgi:hypothetical protein
MMLRASARTRATKARLSRRKRPSTRSAARRLPAGAIAPSISRVSRANISS